MAIGTLKRPTTSNSNGKPSVKQPQVRLMTITPQQAEEWLNSNTHNRPLRNRQVEELAGAIQRGEFVLNGDMIRFDTNGTLIDGQHRLWAVVTAEMPIQSYVATDLPPDVQDTVDRGSKRTLADVLKLRGEVNVTWLAAVLSAKWRLDNDLVQYPGRKPTVAQAIAILNAHPNIRQGYAPTGHLVKTFRVSGYVAGLAWYEFASIDGEAANTFFELLSSGANLPEGSPILVLRRWLEHQMSGRIAPVMAYALFIKAWNAWRRGERVSNLTWRPAGRNPEAFPQPA